MISEFIYKFWNRHLDYNYAKDFCNNRITPNTNS